MSDREALATLYKMADEEIQRPGDNDQRFRALMRIRGSARQLLLQSYADSTDLVPPSIRELIEDKS